LAGVEEQKWQKLQRSSRFALAALFRFLSKLGKNSYKASLTHRWVAVSAQVAPGASIVWRSGAGGDDGSRSVQVAVDRKVSSASVTANFLRRPPCARNVRTAGERFGSQRVAFCRSPQA